MHKIWLCFSKLVCWGVFCWHLKWIRIMFLESRLANRGPDTSSFWVLLYTPYISRGFYFREFRESGAIRELINTRKYLPPIPTHECDLCTQYIALLDREFNHSRKCLKVPIREKLDSRNIWRIQYLILGGCLSSEQLFLSLTFNKRETLHSGMFALCVLLTAHQVSQQLFWKTHFVGSEER